METPPGGAAPTLYRKTVRTTLLAQSGKIHKPKLKFGAGLFAPKPRSSRGRAMYDAPRLTSFISIDADRRVAHVQAGPFSIGSLGVIGCETGKPTVSWPRTSRGYPIIEVEDPLRSDIEALVLAAERGDQVVPPQPRRRRAR